MTTIKLTAYDRIEYAYNRQGEQTSRCDQNGTLRSFQYDKLGRLTGDLVTTPGAGIDTQILAIARTYTPLGLPERVTSSGSANAVVNEVAMVYNQIGLLVTDYQEHAGAVNEGTSLNVQYHYDETADEDGELTAGLRPAQVVYPNGRVLRYEYIPGDDDALNRISLLADDDDGNVGTVLSRYTRLGLSQIVAEEYPQPRLRYDLTHESFSGLDRFGRVVDHLWRNDRGFYDVVRIRQAYDRAGNRLWRQDAVARSMGLDHDEFYTYDSLDQLTNYAHGGLNPQKTAIAAATLRQSWELDATGNWRRFREDSDGDGKWDIIQTRTHNPANELVSAETWSTPAYDAAGNMTSLPKPSEPLSSLTCVYDAWNRLVSVSDNGVVVGQYSYDGKGRRIVKAFDGHSPGDPQGIDRYEHVYLSGDQVIEARRFSSRTPDPWPPVPAHQFIWSLRYIDAPILRDASFDVEGQCNDERLYYLNDRNFSIVALANSNGEVVERYSYSAYGQPVIFAGDWAAPRTASVYGNTTLYTGREFYAASGLFDYRARYYSVGLGAFLARDRLVYDAGPNVLAYCRGNPVNRTDPYGDEPIHGGGGDQSAAPPNVPPAGIKVAETTCDVTTGLPENTTTPEFKRLGDCGQTITLIHEAVHAFDILGCCQDAAKAYRREWRLLEAQLRFDDAMALEEKYRKKFEAWIAREKPRFECHAFTISACVAEEAACRVCQLMGSLHGGSAYLQDCCWQSSKAAADDLKAKKYWCNESHNETMAKDCPWSVMTP